jgi:hypothetical protein
MRKGRGRSIFGITGPDAEFSSYGLIMAGEILRLRMSIKIEKYLPKYDADQLKYQYANICFSVNYLEGRSIF